MPYMKAELLFHRKNIEANGGIVEMTIWKIPHLKDKPHGLKYSLVSIHEGKRIVGYDNAEGRAIIGIMGTGSIVISFRMWML